jgi:replicative DNA helicase
MDFNSIDLNFVRSRSTTLAEVLPQVVASIEAQACLPDGTSVKSGLSSGFDEMDRITSGMSPGELIVVAARPGNGRYAFALDVALHVATVEKCPVQFYSLISLPEEIAMRMLSLASDVEYKKLTTATLDDTDWQSLSRGLGKLHDAQISIEHLKGNQLEQLLKSMLRNQLDSDNKKGLVVVDAFQLFDFSHSSLRVDEAHRAALAALRSLALELGLVVLLVSGLNCQLENRLDKRPLLHDLPRHGMLETMADTVLLLYRDAFYHGIKSGDDPSMSQIEVCVAKTKWDFYGSCQLMLSGKNFPVAAYWGH